MILGFAGGSTLACPLVAMQPTVAGNRMEGTIDAGSEESVELGPDGAGNVRIRFAFAAFKPANERLAVGHDPKVRSAGRERGKVMKGVGERVRDRRPLLYPRL